MKKSRLLGAFSAGIFSLGLVATAEASVIFSQTQTGAELLSNPNVSFPAGTQTLVGSSLLLEDGGVFGNMLQWDILPSAARGDLVFTFTIDFTAETIDNDPSFGIGDGTNYQGLKRLDNTGGSLGLLNGTLGATSVTSPTETTTPHDNLGAVSSFTYVMNVSDFGTGSTTISSYTEGGFNTTSPLTFPGNHLNTDNALSFFVIGNSATEDYRINQVSVTVETVPVPAAVWLFGSGLIGLIGIAKRKKS